MEKDKSDKDEKSGSALYNPYQKEINEARLSLDKACDKKDYQKIYKELENLHTYFLNTQIQYTKFISGLEKDLQREGISSDSKSMLEKLIEDLKFDEEKMGRCVSEIIKRQNEYEFTIRQIARMKLQLLIIPLTNPYMQN
jgi:hypothetical protein